MLVRRLSVMLCVLWLTIAIGHVTFDALFPALLGGLGVILLVSGLARRR